MKNIQKKTTNRNISILKTKLNNLINFGTAFFPLLHNLFLFSLTFIFRKYEVMNQFRLSMLKKYYIRIENIFPDEANDNALCNVLTCESIFLGKK